MALPAALQATPGMRVGGRSAQNGLRVPDSRAAVWGPPRCTRVHIRGGGLCASPPPSAWGRGVEPRGRGGPPHYLLPTHPPRQEGYPIGPGNPGPPQAGSFGVSPHLPDQTGARDGRGRGRAWESGWDKGVPLHGDPLRGDCRVPWEAEEPWGSGPFGQQVGPEAVL